MVTSAVSLGLAFYFCWKITLVLLATMLISGFVVPLINRGLEPAIKSQKRDLARASKHATSAISAIDIVKVFNGFDTEVWQYYVTIRSSMQQYLKQARCQSMQLGYIVFWVILLFVIGFWYGVVLVNQGLQPSAVLTTFYATLAAFQGIEALMPQWLVLAKGMSAGRELQELTSSLDKGHGVAPTALANIPAECAGFLELRNVTISVTPTRTQLMSHR
jgi:ATP-binding cassette, subfamily B (MDR/TAP), member 1